MRKTVGTVLGSVPAGINSRALVFAETRTIPSEGSQPNLSNLPYVRRVVRRSSDRRNWARGVRCYLHGRAEPGMTSCVLR